eukprot:6570814-Pyramimonas_sp.AAC.1
MKNGSPGMGRDLMGVVDAIHKFMTSATLAWFLALWASCEALISPKLHSFSKSWSERTQRSGAERHR